MTRYHGCYDPSNWDASAHVDNIAAYGIVGLPSGLDP